MGSEKLGIQHTSPASILSQVSIRSDGKVEEAREGLTPVLENTNRAAARLTSRLKVVFGDKAQYKKLLNCRDGRAQKLLDLFQELLDTAELDTSFRRSLIVATQRLSKASGIFPTCYDLKDVEYAGHPVAAGSFSDIYKGNFRGQPVCVKAIRLYRTSPQEIFLKKYATEALLWGQLAHPNVCPIYGLYRRGSGLCLVLPWMENGNLNDYLDQYPDADRPLLVCDAAQGLSYLHDNDIVHGDLKGANILVSASGRARLADFGLSSVTDANIVAWTSNSSAESKGGSVRWQAPELFDFESDMIVPNTKASDVYALSSACYEAFAGAVPFSHLMIDATVILHVKAGNTPSRPPIDSVSWGTWGLTEDIWATMMASWNADPTLRPTAHDIVETLKHETRQDQRPADDGDTLSPTRFREEMSVRQDVFTVDTLEKLVGIDPIPLFQSTGSSSWNTIAIDQGSPSLERDEENYVKMMINLALTYENQGRFKEAEELWVSVVGKCKRMLEMDNPWALNVVANLADAYYWQAWYTKAEELQLTLVEKRKQTLGVDDPNTLQAMSRLALTYCKQQRWKEAEELQVVVMKKRKETLGLNHLDTLNSMADLAVAYYRQRRYEEAEELLRIAMEEREQRLGVDDPSALSIMSNLGLIYCRQGRWKEAMELSAMVVKRGQIPGGNDPDTLNSMNHLAEAHFLQGHWEKAGELWAVSMQKHKQMLGVDHPDTLFVMCNLGVAYYWQARLKESEELLLIVVEKQKQTMGVDTPCTLRTMSGLAHTYSMQGRWKEAEELRVVLVEKLKQMLGEGDPNTLNSMNQLADTYKSQGRTNEAKKLQAEVMEIKKRIFVPYIDTSPSIPLEEKDQVQIEPQPVPHPRSKKKFSFLRKILR